MRAQGQNLLPKWFAPWRADLSRPGQSSALSGDLSAALIVTLMLIPQSLAYALLAGMPAHLGLYASVLPLIAYALFGRSPALAVGPVAIAAVMTFEAIAPFAVPGSPEWVTAGVALALLSGLVLFAFGLLRLGFVADLLSHPVMSGFMSGAALLIILGQTKALTAIPIEGETAFELAASLFHQRDQAQLPTLLTGITTLVVLILTRRWMGPALQSFGLRGSLLAVLTKGSPLLVLAGATLALGLFGWGDGVRTVGQVPTGLPALQVPHAFVMPWRELLLSALLIGLVGFIESVSMARAIGQRLKVPVDANAELRGLGAANIAAGLSGAFPVTGGLSRSVVNLEAGAQTPMAGVYSACLMLLVLLGAGSLLSSIPLAGLAALIVVAVSSLIDWQSGLKAWRFDRADGLAWLLTFAGVIVLGVESGILLGIVLSVGIILWRLSRPHMAEMGRLPNSEHFRNVLRHQVETLDHVVFLRVDANLSFGNWTRIRDFIDDRTGRLQAGGWLVLSLASVNEVDSTALDGLIELKGQLNARGVGLALAEVKGPLSDKLERVEGNDWSIYLSTHEAFEALRNI